jgi:methylated-DNA-protein-cysteine methyltransferase-like protein
MQRIWSAIRDIPPGSVASYGQIADITGIRRGARQVGYALRHLPPGHDVPWHRVITASGRIAFAEGSDRFNEQANRLMMEDVAVGGGKVNMKQYRWQPDLDELLWKPTDAWDDDLG